MNWISGSRSPTSSVAAMFPDQMRMAVVASAKALPISVPKPDSSACRSASWAASTVATLLQIRKATIRECLENFQAVEHRLEPVLRINKVNYINDSKATNVNATFYALESMKQPTVWIVGGVDKGNDYTELLPLVNEKVKAIICLGTDNDKIISTFGNVVDLLVEREDPRRDGFVLNESLDCRLEENRIVIRVRASDTGIPTASLRSSSRSGILCTMPCRSIRPP